MSTIPPETEHACLLHLEYHVMQSECWQALIMYRTVLMLHHFTLTDQEIRDLYQAEFEARILNRFIREGVI